MAISKADFNNINITPTASKAITFNSGADGFEAGDLGGSMVLLSTQTASGSANLTFDSSIDSTYDSYVFKFINIHPVTDDTIFQVNFRDGSTAYDATKTTTFFDANLGEDGSGGSLGYVTGSDLAQSTSAQRLTRSVGNGNDESTSGELFLYSPSSTTFVKHFIATTNTYVYSNYSFNQFVAGYCNVTAAIDGVQFAMLSGNIDSGVIKMYGIT